MVCDDPRFLWARILSSLMLLHKNKSYREEEMRQYNGFHAANIEIDLLLYAFSAENEPLSKRWILANLATCARKLSLLLACDLDSLISTSVQMGGSILFHCRRVVHLTLFYVGVETMCTSQTPRL